MTSVCIITFRQLLFFHETITICPDFLNLMDSIITADRVYYHQHCVRYEYLSDINDNWPQGPINDGSISSSARMSLLS